MIRKGNPEGLYQKKSTWHSLEGKENDRKLNGWKRAIKEWSSATQNTKIICMAHNSCPCIVIPLFCISVKDI
ncbi:hypothetical protein NQ315_000463 [Exocentrus adspersus]|uniref:Uncharacterized protein n=1 Tax=Exocentrus adspersus TaxID=1586481 RepID=A0AAV8VE99_9CUCU|nr:hypothetical protein NQ315_000463 [Exocentrus adspersus]